MSLRNELEFRRADSIFRIIVDFLRSGKKGRMCVELHYN